jgi:hypothetical protein
LRLLSIRFETTGTNQEISDGLHSRVGEVEVRPPIYHKVFEKYLRISEPALLSEAYDFWVGVYSPKFRAEIEEIETYFALSGIKAKAQDFVDNSIVNELDREGFFEQINNKYGLR